MGRPSSSVTGFRSFSGGCAWRLADGDGRPLNREEVTRAFKRLAQKAGVRPLSLHKLRHRHATLLLAANVHPKVVSERLGHATVGITLDTYSHVLPNLQEARKIDALLAGPGRRRSNV
jgi:integrase